MKKNKKTKKQKHLANEFPLAETETENVSEDHNTTPKIENRDDCFLSKETFAENSHIVLVQSILKKRSFLTSCLQKNTTSYLHIIIIIYAWLPLSLTKPSR